jgi:hypothetical protein
MRNANVQRKNIMGHAGALQQPPPKHVSHAETGGFSERGAMLAGSANYDGQRCALLTTKSRNTCTRATVFNSSG